jgi:hypothetical protein
MRAQGVAEEMKACGDFWRGVVGGVLGEKLNCLLKVVSMFRGEV